MRKTSRSPATTTAITNTSHQGKPAGVGGVIGLAATVNATVSVWPPLAIEMSWGPTTAPDGTVALHTNPPEAFVVPWQSAVELFHITE